MYIDRWVLVCLIAFSGLTGSVLSLMAWRRRQSALGRTFLFLTLAFTVYNFGYMFELASDTLEQIRFWLRVESLGIAFWPTAWIMFAGCHTDRRSKFWPWLYASSLVVSTITFILSNTSELHHLYYGPLRLNSDAPFPIAIIVPGVWYWVHTIFSNLAILFCNIVFAYIWMKAPCNRKQQAFVLFLGSLFPWAVYIVYLLQMIPWGIDPNPIAFLVPGLLYGWAVFGLNLLDVAPIAQREIFQSLSNGVLVFDRDGYLVDFNAAGSKVFPELSSDGKGKDATELFRGYPSMMELLSGPTNMQKLMCWTTGSRRNNYQLQRIELYDQERHMIGFMIVFWDITHFSTIVEGLQLQAAIDPLTGAWNRNRWQAQGQRLVAQACQQQTALSLILIDLDRFKPVNDTYGHLVGDAVLSEFALTCKNNLRAQDVFGRFGGDEFVIILPGMTTSEAVELTERLKRAVRSMTVAAGEHTIQVTASFGVATVSDGGLTSLEELIAKADQALYEAKKNGNMVQSASSGSPR